MQRGQELYKQTILADIDELKNRGQMLVINVETGEYEMDADDVAAAKRHERSALHDSKDD